MENAVKSVFVAEYPKWTTGTFMLGMGTLGGATVGFLTTQSPVARSIEGVFIVIAIIAATIPTIMRLRYRRMARAQFAAQGGNPSDLRFI